MGPDSGTLGPSPTRSPADVSTLVKRGYRTGPGENVSSSLLQQRKTLESLWWTPREFWGTIIIKYKCIQYLINWVNCVCVTLSIGFNFASVCTVSSWAECGTIFLWHILPSAVPMSCSACCGKSYFVESSVWRKVGLLFPHSGASC